MVPLAPMAMAIVRQQLDRAVEGQEHLFPWLSRTEGRSRVTASRKDSVASSWGSQTQRPFKPPTLRRTIFDGPWRQASRRLACRAKIVSPFSLTRKMTCMGSTTINTTDSPRSALRSKVGSPRGGHRRAERSAEQCRQDQRAPMNARSRPKPAEQFIYGDEQWMRMRAIVDRAGGDVARDKFDAQRTIFEKMAEGWRDRHKQWSGRTLSAADADAYRRAGRLTRKLAAVLDELSESVGNDRLPFPAILVGNDLIWESPGRRA